MKSKVLTIIGLLVLIVALPILLRRESATVDAAAAQDSLVVISPHNESIRYEIGEAFASWWKQKTGRTMHVDWRSPGGTSEIRMMLDAGYKAAAETQREGVGIDVFFGGGAPDFKIQAASGRLVPLEVFTTHKELFTANDGIPEIFTGEPYYTGDRNWVATSVSQFGICYNPAFVSRLGLEPPHSWQDLANPGYAGTIALADPTKSGSVARTFELIVQSRILAHITPDTENLDLAIEQGWANGLQLIQSMAANARYFTDSASKIPHEVGQGNAAAGMCIDFYGRSYATELTSKDGLPRLVWTAPYGGTTLSGDPVAVLKGAPHPDTAQEFVKFLLSKDAQLLWFTKVGAPHGPKQRALHRSPVRRDLYQSQYLVHSTTGGQNPYSAPSNFTYNPALTGKAYDTLRLLIKAMCIDSHDDMKRSWLAIKAAGMPEEAVQVFHDTSAVSYADFGRGNPLLDGKDPFAAAREAARIGAIFRDNYRRAEAIARVHMK